jgi:hypothetical protein
MKRTFRTATLGLAAVAAVLMASLLTTSQPAQAQAPPTPIQCTLTLNTSQAWDTQTWLTRTFACDTVEAQTRARLIFPCIPSPTCTPRVQFESRARRRNVANILLARAQANPGPVCVHQPSSTAWTSWAVCGDSVRLPPPAALSLNGARMP